MEPDLKNEQEKLEKNGWRLAGSREWIPLVGRYWVMEAVHTETGRRVKVEAATLKMALKKIQAKIK